jgi:hypothetical protein
MRLTNMCTHWAAKAAGLPGVIFATISAASYNADIVDLDARACTSLLDYLLTVYAKSVCTFHWAMSLNVVRCSTSISYSMTPPTRQKFALG